MVNSLLKRSASHSSGLVVGKVITTVVMIFLARVLMPELFGQLLLFITISQLATVLGDFGLKQWYQKKAHLFTRNKTFAQVLAARFFTLILSILIVSIGILYFQPFTLTITLVLIALLISESLISMAEGYHLELGHATKVGLKNPSVMLVFSLGWIISGFSTNLNIVLALWFLGSLTTTFWFFPWKELKKMTFFSLDKVFSTLKSASSYALLTSTSLIYSRGDSLIIERMLGSASLGFYGSAYRYLESLALLPSALTQNLFPIAARKDGIKAQQLWKVTLLMAFLGILFSTLLFLSSDILLIKLLGNEYSPAIPVLQLFSIVLFLFFVNAPLSAVVQSSKLVRHFLPFGILNTITNIILNLILIPTFGIVASAMVMIATELTGLIINLLFVRAVYEK